MDAHERQLLAGEYVLGTLDAAARREVEAARDPELEREIRRWEQRLAPLALKLAPIAPRPIVWLNLLHAIGDGFAPMRAASQPYRWLRTWAAVATAASLVLGFGLYREASRPGLVPIVFPKRVPAPVYVTQLAVPKSTMHWTVSVSANQLAVRAGGEAPAAAAKLDAELWLITAAGPVSLGVIPKAGEVRRAVAETLPFAAGATLAVSLEPAGGSPTGAPTGPVVTTATLLQAS